MGQFPRPVKRRLRHFNRLAGWPTRVLGTFLLMRTGRNTHQSISGVFSLSPVRWEHSRIAVSISSELPVSLPRSITALRQMQIVGIEI
jgi:hypothetical protein